ncbi:dihydrofolate reductase-thymidylate synthase [Chrysochromulina tobinii]|uniref:Bifunctional dihydrofolate reductase-thymidylate synthase n=1 Tax=Chrysochromulina tobinii TaxID=1460289 RepID=A0A0M0JXL9_9EUKA|nr:dihydrofolate reductase-thymidylate synthase [Chrysochromulina tobinii]|eukprot:KOO31314.1 dihydrofolate reductase-thymidylate synthase [Chrysochromulina sp. CCMP291]
MVLAADRKQRSFAVVVATCKQTRGIGQAGALPWRLRADMAYFKQLTRSTRDPTKRNAVIMGRKTWQSIPTKFRPLDDRVNVVLSRTADTDSLELPKGVLCASSLPQALELLGEDTEAGATIENVFVIGGASVYEEAIAMPACARIHLTEIEQVEEAAAAGTENTAVQTDGASPAPPTAKKPRLSGFECDTFFPPLASGAYVEGARSAARVENGLRYEFMRFDLSTTFPLLTTKRVFWRGVAEELLWFLNGETSAKKLQDKGIGIWDGNSSREYLDSIGLTDREVGDLGPVYGWQWRHFGATYTDMHADYKGQGVDQVAEVLDKLKNKPHDRRIIMTAWNPADLSKMALPPCHMFAQFYVADGTLSCQMYQRSADLGLGVPFNIASYALLTCLFAHLTGLKRGTFVHTIGDAHVYLNHVDALKEQLERSPRAFPTLRIDPKVDSVEGCTFGDLTIEGYNPYGKIKMDMAV